VPKYGAHLVGTGICGDVVCSTEAIVHFPPFPYVIASSGKFHSSGGLLVAGVQKLEDGLIKSGSIDEKKLLPGSLAANSADAVEAIVLGPDTKITGNVQSPGKIKLDPNGGSVVLGEIRSNAAPVVIPTIDIASYDPELKNSGSLQTLPAKLENQKLEGFCRRKGDLEISGDISLDGAILYVDGNLKVKGGIKGKGAIFVTGTTTVEHGAVVDTDNMAALLSKGDVSLGGYGKGSSAFQGVVYTEGNFTADNITLLGSFLTNAKGGKTDIGVSPDAGGSRTADKGKMAINNASLVEVPQYTKITFPVKAPAPAPKPTATPAPPPAPSFSSAIFQSSGQGTDTRLLSPWGPVQYFVSIWPVLNIESVKDTSTNPPTYRPEWVTRSNSIMIAFGRTNPWSNTPLPYDAAMAKFAHDWNYGFCYAAVQQDVEIAYARIKADVAAYDAQYQQYMLSLQQKPAETPTDSGPGTSVTDGLVNFSFDINKFLSLKDRMRVLLWRERKSQ
jgi:cytoskeletal protein CcmA (bactofilin family)